MAVVLLDQLQGPPPHPRQRHLQAQLENYGQQQAVTTG